MVKQTSHYTNQQLYGANGEPQIVDIKQDELNDCYLVSSMGALAEQQPDRIRDAIRYEPDHNISDTNIIYLVLHLPVRSTEAMA
jgi:hypothetical protein